MMFLLILQNFQRKQINFLRDTVDQLLHILNKLKENTFSDFQKFYKIYQQENETHLILRFLISELVLLTHEVT